MIRPFIANESFIPSTSSSDENKTNGEYPQQPPELPVRRPYVSQHSLDFGSLDKNLKESSVDPSSADESEHDYETPVEILNKQSSAKPVHNCLAEDIIAQFDDLPEDSVDPVTDEISSASSTEDANLPEDPKECPSASSFEDVNTSQERKPETEELPTEKAVTEKNFYSADVSNETSTDEEEDHNLFQFEVSRPKQSEKAEKSESMLEKPIAIVRLKSHSLSDENTSDLIPRVKSPFYSDEELLEVEKSLDDLDKHLTDNELDVETDDEELFIVDSTKSYPKIIPTTANTEDFRSDTSSEDEGKEQNSNDVVDKVKPGSDSEKSEKVIGPVSVKEARLTNGSTLPQEENKTPIESKETLRLEKEENLSDLMESKAYLSVEMPEDKEEEDKMVAADEVVVVATETKTVTSSEGNIGSSVADHTVDVNAEEHLDEKMETSQLKKLKPETLHDDSIDVTEHDERERQLLSDEEIKSVIGVIGDTNVKTYKKDATEQQKEEQSMVASDEVVVLATETKTEAPPEGNIGSSVSDQTVDVNTEENLDEKMEASQLKELKPETVHDDSIDVTDHDERGDQLLSDEEIEPVTGVLGVLGDTNVKTYKKVETEKQKEEHNMVVTDEVVVVATETKTETSPEGNIGLSASDHIVDVNTEENLGEKMEASQLKELKPETLHNDSIDVTEHDERECQLLSDEDIESVTGALDDANVNTYKKDATEQQKEEHDMEATDKVVVVAIEKKPETSPEGNIGSSVSDHTVDVNTEENLDEEMEASQLKELKPETLHDDSIDVTEHDERECQLLSDEEIKSVTGVLGDTNVKTYEKDATAMESLSEDSDNEVKQRHSRSYVSKTYSETAPEQLFEGKAENLPKENSVSDTKEEKVTLKEQEYKEDSSSSIEKSEPEKPLIIVDRKREADDSLPALGTTMTAFTNTQPEEDNEPNISSEVNDLFTSEALRRELKKQESIGKDFTSSDEDELAKPLPDKNMSGKDTSSESEGIISAELSVRDKEMEKRNIGLKEVEIHTENDSEKPEEVTEEYRQSFTVAVQEFSINLENLPDDSGKTLDDQEKQPDGDSKPEALFNRIPNEELEPIKLKKGSFIKDYFLKEAISEVDSEEKENQVYSQRMKGKMLSKISDDITEIESWIIGPNVNATEALINVSLGTQEQLFVPPDKIDEIDKKGVDKRPHDEGYSSPRDARTFDLTETKIEFETPEEIKPVLRDYPEPISPNRKLTLLKIHRVFTISGFYNVSAVRKLGPYSSYTSSTF